MLSQYNALISQLPIQFAKAKESGHLNSYPSTTEIVNDNGLDFEIRICPALEAKRAAAKESESISVNEDGKPVPSGKRQRIDSDPFEGPYDGNDLYLGKVGQEEDGEKMVGLLNRFSVVDHHFLLVSEEFQSQSSPLHPPHLLHAYLTLMALKNAGQEFIAVYNCGEKSGASQKRRHIQFIPVNDNDEPLVDQWTSGAILARADLPFILPYLPFSHAFARLPPALSARSSKDPSVIAMALLSAHIALLDSIHAAIWSQSDSSSTKATPGESLSYNVVLTLQHMVLVPRYKEKSELVSLEESGGLSLNSMAFAGMVLTSGEREKEEVKRVGVLNVLASVGYEIVEAKESVEERSMDEGSLAE